MVQIALKIYVCLKIFLGQSRKTGDSVIPGRKNIKAERISAKVTEALKNWNPCSSKGTIKTLISKLYA